MTEFKLSEKRKEIQNYLIKMKIPLEVRVQIMMNIYSQDKEFIRLLKEECIYPIKDKEELFDIIDKLAGKLLIENLEGGKER